MSLDTNDSGAASTAHDTNDSALHDDAPLLRRSLIWGIAAGSSSMVVHLALLLVLGLIVNSLPVSKPPVICEFTPPEEPRDQIPEKLEKQIIASPTLEPNTSPPPGESRESTQMGIQGAVNAAVGKPKLTAAVVAATTRVSIDPGVVNVFRSSAKSLTEDLPTSTGSIEGAKDYAQAMDRITQEILNKLAKRKVLLVWIFDQSDSMTDDRDEITLRIDRVYQELGLASASKNNALLTAVTSYGDGFSVLTPQPTSKPDEIIGAIKAVPVDPTGEEKMCRAVTASIAQYQRFAESQDRQMMCVLVTDESGDPTSNFADLEQTIQTAAAARSPIYVLGREAVFGYPYAHIRWTDPDTKYQAWIRIDRGPESPYPEQLQVDGFHRRFDAHPSGFGPYEQSRMARQTGGVFFMLPSPEANLVGRDTRNYDPDTMRAYLPDLSSRDAYAAERDKYPMRAMLWKVISDLNPYDKRLEQHVQVRLHNWPIDRAAYAREADAQIKKAQLLIQYYAQAQQALETVGKHRDRDPSVRWRANYDLAHAQTIAYQARLHDYVAYIGLFMKTPKAIKNELGPTRPTNEWNAALIGRTLVNDPKVAELRDRSTALYRQIAKDYHGTPWAARADLEIHRPFGLELREGHEVPRGNGGRPIPKQ
jgi:hypothetical protein